MTKLHYAEVIFCFILYFTTSSSALNSLQVSSQDLTFGLSENGSFRVFTSQPASESISIWFSYDTRSNIYPLTNDTVIEKGTTGNINYNVQPFEAGHTTILVNATPLIVRRKDAFVRVGVYKSGTWLTISSVIGWLYFVAWSISFYPQAIENYMRKSVIGLNFDFLGLNLTGFIAYSVFNIGVRFVKEVQLEYHQSNPTGVIPVEVNDVIFAVHATFITAITIGQCFYYERGDQKIAKVTVAVLAVVWLTAAVFLLVTALGVNPVTPWLTFLYFFSSVKLGVTLTKYIPQVVYNYRRKSTVGWSIGMVLLDFVGGIFSIGQMFITAWNFNDWHSVIGNFTKFGLGLASVAFDVIFMVQHYALYRYRNPDSLEDNLLPPRSTSMTA